MLYRYFVKEKHDGWGAKYSPEERTGEWEFNVFTADGKVANQEDTGRFIYSSIISGNYHQINKSPSLTLKNY